MLTKDIEDRRPATGKAILTKEAGEREREDGPKMSTWETKREWEGEGEWEWEGEGGGVYRSTLSV